MIKALILCSAFLAVSLGERLYSAPDTSWRQSGSSDSGSGVAAENNVRPSSLGRDNSGSSDSDRFPITGGNSRSGSVSSRGSQSAGGFGFDQDNTGNSGSGDSRFPVTGGSGSGSRPGSRGSVGSGSGSTFGSSQGSGGRVSGSSSGSFGGSVDSTTKNYYVRIVASIIRLTNDKALTSTGSSCAMFGKCDPIVKADLDADRPNANWPGARDAKTWPIIYTSSKRDSFDIGVDNITKDVCGQNYREANLRVRVEDKKTLTSNAVINEFDCPINRVPDDSSSSASWSPVTNCIPRFPAGKQTLSFRYKVYYVSRSICGITTAPQTTTKSSFFGK